MRKIIETIKKKWLRDTVLSIVLVSIILLAFIALNLWVNTLNVTALDFTQDKLYTLSDESKELVKNVDKEVTVYFFGLEDENNTAMNFVKQYAAANSNIKIDVVKVAERPDLAQKYEIDTDPSQVIVVVACGEREKILSASDFYTYDTITYETIDITEEKLTNAILDVTTEEKPVVYFLTGHGEYSTTKEMVSFATLLENEIIEVKTLDLLKTSFPEKCDTLIIATPSKDFADTEVEAITKYINNGGNILWMQDASLEDRNLPNVQKILNLYGVSFNKGILLEQDDSKMLLQNPQLIIPTVNAHTITKDIYANEGVMFASSGKLTIADSTKLEELKVSVNAFITSSEKAFYRDNFNLTSYTKQSNEEAAAYTIGAECVKTTNDEKTSKLVVYADNYFATDATITAGNQYIYMMQLYNNKDLALNTVAYLTEKEDSIRIRKNTGTVTYTVTEQQDKIVKAIIFGVPILIVATGIVVWILRRRK